MYMSSQSLTDKTIHSIKWTYTSTIVNASVQIGFTAVMARLLEPESFGLVAMAGVVLRFGQYFAQMGVSQALIQKKELSNEDIRAGFTSSLLLGTLFFLLAYFAAPLAGRYYEIDAVVPILRVMALSFVVSGLSATAMSILRREMRFKPLAITEISTYILGYGGVGITMALMGFGVWSLVGGVLAQSFLTALSYLVITRHDLRFTFRWGIYKPLYMFGSRVSIISFLEFIGSSLDTLIIGRFLGAGPLGIYNRAYMLISLPVQNFSTSLSKVLFPAFSRLQTDIHKLAKAYLSTIRTVAHIILPVGIGMAVASQQIILTLLGSQWNDAIPVLQILALALPIQLLTHFTGVTFEATNNLNQKLIIQGFYVPFLGVLIYLAVPYGIFGIAIAMFFAISVRNIVYNIVAVRILRIKLISYSRIILSALTHSLIVGSAIYVATLSFKYMDIPKLIELLMQIIVGGAMLCIILYFGTEKNFIRPILLRFRAKKYQTVNII
jgi:O-antigen/teichoic acid export membrane protein